MAAKRATPAALKLKKCTQMVRRGGEQIKCGREHLEGCPNNHLLAMPTGFCNSGWHEGSKATDWRGKPAPICKFIETCPCACHDELDKLFTLTGKERILVDVSGYQRSERTYWLPSDDPDPVFSTHDSNGVPVIIESPAPDLVPATLGRDFAPTPTGRAARGELEAWVKEQCDIWLIDAPGNLCTPSYLADQIAHDQGITPPSVGAISSVFERWIKLGFAVVEKKPTRFVKYTDDGVRLGLDRMKADSKRKFKLTEAEKKRNLIR